MSGLFHVLAVSIRGAHFFPPFLDAFAGFSDRDLAAGPGEVLRCRAASSAPRVMTRSRPNFFAGSDPSNTIWRTRAAETPKLSAASFVVKASFSMCHKIAPGNCLRKSDYLFDDYLLSFGVSPANKHRRKRTQDHDGKEEIERIII